MKTFRIIKIMCVAFALILLVGFLLTGCSTKKSNKTLSLSSKLEQLSEETDLNVKAEKYTKYFEITGTLPHGEKYFTEGLFMDNGMMYESTGLEGESAVYERDVETGKTKMIYEMPSHIFGEGSSVMGDKFYQLTYKNNVAYRCTKDFSKISTYDYNREGWGLTTDGEVLFASDGSSTIHIMDENLTDIDSISVTFNGRPLDQLNELEYIDGYIWANVWCTDMIVIINPDDGRVLKAFDFSEILDKNSCDYDVDVLNGIAYDQENGLVYVTGKWYPSIYCLTEK